MPGLGSDEVQPGLARVVELVELAGGSVVGDLDAVS